MRALILFGLLCGCGTEYPGVDYLSSAGVSYSWKTSSFEPQLLEENETWFLTQLQGLGRFNSTQVAQTLSQARVLVYGEPIPCSEPRGCNGLQDQNFLYVRDRSSGCPFDSALNHELTHLIQQRLEGRTDYQHLDLSLWEMADSRPRACP